MKMEKINLIIFCCFLFACKPEIVDPDFKTNLTIDAVIEYLPDSYFEDSKLIFVNNEGIEKTLISNSGLGTTISTHRTKEYKAENFEVSLTDPNDLGFYIILTGGANYFGDENKIITYLDGKLMPFNNSGTTWFTINFEDNSPIVGFGDNFQESAVFNDREFKDVYINIGKEGNVQHEAFSELNVNSEYGVIAFRDAENNLWALDRIENQ